MKILPKAIIVDIDGTLANIDHRRHFVEPHCIESSRSMAIPGQVGMCKWDKDGTKFRPDWKSFNEAMKDDRANDWCVELIEKMSFSCCSREICVIFVTGREDKYREVTLRQINKWVCIYELPSEEVLIEVFMRPSGDYRSDVDIKREIYDNYIKDKYDVLFAIDDRKKIVDLWRSLGIVCLDCAGYG